MKSYLKQPHMNLSAVIVLTLGAVYLLFSIGIIKSTHFCMGREASVAYFTSESEKCACGVFAFENDGCCDDEHELIKIEDSQKAISTFVFSPAALVVLEELVNLTFLSHYGPPLFIRTADGPQPPVARFKLFRSLRFYDDVLSA
jgi:hypothetical protein